MSCVVRTFSGGSRCCRVLLEGRAAGPEASGPAGGRGSADRLSPESVGCDIFSWRSILVCFPRSNRQPCGPASEFFSGSSAVASAVRSSVYADNAWGSSVVTAEISRLAGTGRNAGRAGETSRALPSAGRVEARTAHFRSQCDDRNAAHRPRHDMRFVWNDSARRFANRPYNRFHSRPCDVSGAGRCDCDRTISVSLSASGRAMSAVRRGT